MCTSTLSRSLQACETYTLTTNRLNSDIVDRDIDAQVERTKKRALPSGRISLRAAWVWHIVQVLVASLWTHLTLGPRAHLLAISGYPIYYLYPFSKRFFAFPQLILGVALAWPALAGWSVGWQTLDGEFAGDSLLGQLRLLLPHCRPAFQGSPSSSLQTAPVSTSGVLPIFAVLAVWILYYDTAYAHQDARDDRKLKLNSTAVFFNADGMKLFLYALASVTVALLAAATLPGRLSAVVASVVVAPFETTTPRTILSLVGDVVMCSLPAWWAWEFAMQ